MEDELFDLSTMAMEYFKEHIEPTLPEITYFGADYLDFTSFSGTCKLTNDFTRLFFKVNKRFHEFWKLLISALITSTSLHLAAPVS